MPGSTPHHTSCARPQHGLHPDGHRCQYTPANHHLSFENDVTVGPVMACGTTYFWESLPFRVTKRLTHVLPGQLRIGMWLCSHPSSDHSQTWLLLCTARAAGPTETAHALESGLLALTPGTCPKSLSGLLRKSGPQARSPARLTTAGPEGTL